MHLQDDDIPGIVRYRTYEVLKEEVKNQALRWAYLPYAMHMAGPREAIQHMIIRKNYGEPHTGFLSAVISTRKRVQASINNHVRGMRAEIAWKLQVRSLPFPQPASFIENMFDWRELPRKGKSLWQQT